MRMLILRGKHSLTLTNTRSCLLYADACQFCIFVSVEFCLVLKLCQLQAWNVYGVLNFLQALVEKSMIIQILEREKEGLERFTATDGYDYDGGSNVLKVLGYFSMVGLLRVHCLLGDYYTGLQRLLPIDISQQGVYTSVIGSHITTIYHYGFANLMLRRYANLSVLSL